MFVDDYVISSSVRVPPRCRAVQEHSHQADSHQYQIENGVAANVLVPLPRQQLCVRRRERLRDDLKRQAAEPNERHRQTAHQHRLEMYGRLRNYQLQQGTVEESVGHFAGDYGKKLRILVQGSRCIHVGESGTVGGGLKHACVRVVVKTCHDLNEQVTEGRGYTQQQVDAEPFKNARKPSP